MKTYLGIEFGSTRIKAVAVGEDFAPASTGDYTWAARYEDGIWTYPLEEVWAGLRDALSHVQGRETVAAGPVMVFCQVRKGTSRFQSASKAR